MQSLRQVKVGISTPCLMPGAASQLVIFLMALLVTSILRMNAFYLRSILLQACDSLWCEGANLVRIAMWNVATYSFIIAELQLAVT